MPVVKHGLAFKYFDKAICGVVALGLLAALFFALSRAGSASRDAPSGPMLTGLAEVEAGLRAQHVDLQPKDFVELIRRRFTDVPVPETVEDFFYPPLPVTYSGLTISTDREFVLQFSEPLEKGSVTVSGEAPLVSVVEHPVDGDYKRVRLSSGSQEGKATVEGATGEGVQHSYPVTVDAEAGKTAYPPDKLAVVSTRNSAVVLQVQPSARNAGEGVEVVEYEVWRRDWEDALGEYRKVAAVAGADVSATSSGLGAYAAAGYEAYGAGGYPGAAQPAVPQGVFWEDSSVVPGERYGYKVRTVGANTYPTASDFTESAMAEVDARVDFRFARSTADTVGCEVLHAFGAIPTTETFWVGVGGEIGGVVKDPMTDEDISYLTGNVLLDFHRSIFLAGSVTDRMIYVDPEGFLRQRLRKETKTGLWESASAAGGTGMRTGAMPTGYGGPGPGYAGPVRGGVRPRR